MISEPLGHRLVEIGFVDGQLPNYRAWFAGRLDHICLCNHLMGHASELKPSGVASMVRLQVLQTLRVGLIRPTDIVCGNVFVQVYGLDLLLFGLFGDSYAIFDRCFRMAA